MAERYGSINRALPGVSLDDFVTSMAHRIARFPAAVHAELKDRVNAVALPPVADIHQDSDLFAERMRTREAQTRTAAAMKRGFQSRDGELDLAGMLGDLTED